MKDSLLAELYVSHIAQRWEHTTTTSTLGPRQTVKTELVGRRTVLAVRHEEETLRMEADILKIRCWGCVVTSPGGGFVSDRWPKVGW